MRRCHRDKFVLQGLRRTCGRLAYGPASHTGRLHSPGWRTGAPETLHEEVYSEWLGDKKVFLVFCYDSEHDVPPRLWSNSAGRQSCSHVMYSSTPVRTNRSLLRTPSNFSCAPMEKLHAHSNCCPQHGVGQPQPGKRQQATGDSQRLFHGVASTPMATLPVRRDAEVAVDRVQLPEPIARQNGAAAAPDGVSNAGGAAPRTPGQRTDGVSGAAVRAGDGGHGAAPAFERRYHPCWNP